MEDIVFTIFNSSLLFILVYPLILLLVPDTIDDKLFSFYDGEMKEENLINQIRILGKINNENYDIQIKQFHLFFADNKISDKEYNEIDRFVTMAYFNNFEDRWIPFKKADMVLKLVCFYSIAAALLIKCLKPCGRYTLVILGSNGS